VVRKAELLVQRDRSRVRDDHLEHHLAGARAACLHEQGAGQSLADAAAARPRDHADAAEPRAVAAEAEIGEAERRPAVPGDERPIEVEVEGADHVREAGLVHLEGDGVALVRGGEELREFGAGQLARAAKLDQRRSSATAWAASPSPRPVNPRKSVVVARTAMRSGSTPSASARAERISSRSGARRGSWPMKMQSAFSSSQPASRTRV
jgi:hypothetical protein